MSRSTAAPPPRLLTVAQAAERLGTTTSKLYELAAMRSIPSVRIGRAIRIPQDDLDRLVDRAGEAKAAVCHDEHPRTSRVDPETSSRIAAVATTPSVDGAAPKTRRPTSRPSRCPNAATARTTPANAVAELS